MSSFHQLSQNLGDIPAFPSLPHSTSHPQTILLPPQNVSKSPGLVTLASGRHLFGFGSTGAPQRPSATTALIPAQPFPTQRPWRALLSVSPMHVIFLLKNSPQFPLHPRGKPWLEVRADQVFQVQPTALSVLCATVPSPSRLRPPGPWPSLQ